MYREEKEWVLAGNKQADQLTNTKNKLRKHILTPYTGVDPEYVIQVQEKDAYQCAHVRSLL